MSLFWLIFLFDTPSKIHIREGLKFFFHGIKIIIMKKQRKGKSNKINLICNIFLNLWGQDWLVDRNMLWNFRYPLDQSVGLWCQRYSLFAQEGEELVLLFLLTLAQMQL